METKKEIQEWIENKWKVEDYFVELLDKLNEVKSFELGITYYYHEKNNMMYMCHNKKYKKLSITNKVWDYCFRNYSEDVEESRILLKQLVELHMNIWNTYIDQ